MHRDDDDGTPNDALEDDGRSPRGGFATAVCQECGHEQSNTGESCENCGTQMQTDPEWGRDD